MFGRGRRVVEAPPQEYLSGPTQTGRTREIGFDDLEALQKFCRALAGTIEPPQRAGDPYTQACYAPGVDIVAVPSRKAWPSQAEIDLLREHEWAHARGWRHNPDGRGTSPKSLPPVGLIGGAYTQGSRP